MKYNHFKLARLVVCLMLVSASFFKSVEAYAQQLTVSGVVLDEVGLPLPGVAIYDKNNLKGGTLSGDDGRYTISVSSSCKELVFDFMGYKTLVLSPKDASKVRMEPDSQMIQETVVTGIYTRKKDSFTGSVQSINSDELKKVGNKNVFESLKNLDPSLLFLEDLEQGSNPNAMANMQLRGTSSLDMGATGLKSNFVSKANTPLFILDGFETSVEKIQDMDMNRIESITILKDASAKAIYGSKGGNGVIVIETKSIDSGRMAQVTYNGGVTLEMPDLTSYNLCNALEKLEVERREEYYTYGETNSMFLYMRKQLYFERLRKALEGESTYWLSKPVRVGVGNKHALSVELGTKELKSISNISFNNVEGAMKGSFRQTFSGDMSLSYRKNDWQVRNIMSISVMNNSESPYGSFSQYALLNPYYNPYDEEGNLVKVFQYPMEEVVSNPLYDASLSVKNGSSYLDFTDNVYVEYSPIKALKFVMRAGVDTKRTEAEEFYPSNHSRFATNFNTQDAFAKAGSFDATNGSYLSWSGDASIQFNQTFAQKHDVFSTFQYNISQMSYSEVTHYAEGFPSSRLNDIIFARQYAHEKTPTGYSGLNRNLGFLLTSGYTYDNRYMVDATIKTSASSVFGTNNKWGVFWSVGAAWNLHNEDFLKGRSWLKQLKLRSSMGSSGNQGFSTNNSLPVYGFNNSYSYNGFVGAGLTNMENKDLGWEEKMDYNIGVDLRTRRLNIVLDAYIADTRNLVFSRTIPASTGFTSVSDNLGRVRNKGVEASFNWTLWQDRTSFFTLISKIAVNDNRIQEISDSMKDFNKQQIDAAASAGSERPVIQYYEGMPVNSIWAVPSVGVDPITGDEYFVNKEGYLTNIWSASNLANCGSSDPLYNGNFGFSSEYKGFGASVIASYYGGGYKYNSTLVDLVENADISKNVDRRIFSDRWYYSGHHAQYRSGTGHHHTSTQQATKATSRFVQRNDVLRLASVSFYYEVPVDIVRKMHLQRMRLSLYGNDLFTWSSIHIERGTSYPYARSISLAATVTF